VTGFAHLRAPLVGAGVLLWAAGCAGVPQEAARLTPLTCLPETAVPPGVEVPAQARLLGCAGAGRPAEVFVVTDADLSWPVLPGRQGARSLQAEMLAALPRFGAGMLFFDPAEDEVWAVEDRTPAQGHVLSLTGNDPVTLAPRRAYLALPSGPTEAASLHASRDAAVRALGDG
jgi:hypothetical protein